MDSLCEISYRIEPLRLSSSLLEALDLLKPQSGVREVDHQKETEESGGCRSSRRLTDESISTIAAIQLLILLPSSRLVAENTRRMASEYEGFILRFGVCFSTRGQNWASEARLKRRTDLIPSTTRAANGDRRD